MGFRESEKCVDKKVSGAALCRYIAWENWTSLKLDGI